MSGGTVTIQMSRYRDRNGKPTCAADFPTGEVCEWYRVTGVCGRQETCLMAPGTGTGRTLLLSRRGRDGTLIPGHWCPLWKGVECE